MKTKQKKVSFWLYACWCSEITKVADLELGWRIIQLIAAKFSGMQGKTYGFGGFFTTLIFNVQGLLFFLFNCG